MLLEKVFLTSFFIYELVLSIVFLYFPKQAEIYDNKHEECSGLTFWCLAIGLHSLITFFLVI